MFKQKAERALLSLFSASAIFPNVEGERKHRVTSQENNETTRSLPCLIAHYQPLPDWRTSAKGEPLGCHRGTLSLILLSSADRASQDEGNAPEADHATNVDHVRDTLQAVVAGTGMAATLSAAEDDFTILAAMVRQNPGVAPVDRCFVEGWAWEIKGYESDD